MSAVRKLRGSALVGQQWCGAPSDAAVWFGITRPDASGSGFLFLLYHSLLISPALSLDMETSSVQKKNRALKLINANSFAA